MTKRKRLKPLKSVLDARMGPDKSEPKDPLAGLKKKYRVTRSVAYPLWVLQENKRDYFDNELCYCRTEEQAWFVARAIARMGAK
jgi:hypothetical protein